MILLAGQSGSGKTAALYALEKLGYSVIPTYSTRKPRPKDKGTICISESEFQGMLMRDRFVSYHVFDSKMGKVAYGISLTEYEDVLEDSVLVLAKEYFDDIVSYLSRRTTDKPFLVYLDVDENSIIGKAYNHPNRKTSNVDLLDRLERDRSKNNYLKSMANLVIDNREFHLSKYEVADTIEKKYRDFIDEKEET